MSIIAILLNVAYVLTCTFLVVLTYFTVILLKQMWKLRKFKGPMPIPLLGNAYTIESALYLLKFLSKMRRKFGSVFTFFGVGNAFLVVCDPVAVRRVLSDSRAFVKGDGYRYHFHRVFGDGLVTSLGDKHKKDRAVFGKYFVRSNIVNHVKRINELADTAVKTILEGCDTPNGKALDIEEFFAVLTLRAFMNFAVDTDLSGDPVFEKKVCNDISEGSYCVGKLMTTNLPCWNIIPWVAMVDKVRDYVGDLVKGLKGDFAKKLSKDEVKKDLHCFQGIVENDMSEKDLVDHGLTLIAAGHDTTAYFSSYFCLILAEHPEIQDKVRAEINTVLNGREEATADDYTECKYTQMVMQETLRLYAVIPMVMRKCVEEVHIKEAGITIPKDTQILVPMFLINRDPQLWENPSACVPERFDGRNEFTHAKNGFFPFGYGVRSCIGGTLAQIESFIFFSKILSKYRIEPEPGFKPQIMAGVSLTTINGIRVILKPI